MQFLKTLFWVLVAVVLALLASRNWFDVTINLWGGIQVDIKLPVLLVAMFLLGFLPPFLIYRARLWNARRRLEVQDRQLTVPTPAPAQAVPETRAE
jgi:lipopolysaccharide assembly protein A